MTPREACKSGSPERRPIQSAGAPLRARLAHHFVLSVVLVAAVALLTSACDAPPQVMLLELVNPTELRLEVRVEGKPYPSHAPWVEPGGTLRVATGRYEWERPRRVQAHDVHGELRFDRSLTAADLDALNWRVALLSSGSP